MTPDEIKALRASMRLTQPAFAARVGCALRTLAAWEAGTRQPRGLYLAALERVRDQHTRQTKRKTPLMDAMDFGEADIAYDAAWRELHDKRWTASNLPYPENHAAVEAIDHEIMKLYQTYQQHKTKRHTE